MSTRSGTRSADVQLPNGHGFTMSSLGDFSHGIILTSFVFGYLGDLHIAAAALILFIVFSLIISCAAAFSYTGGEQITQSGTLAGLNTPYGRSCLILSSFGSDIGNSNVLWGVDSP